MQVWRRVGVMGGPKEARRTSCAPAFFKAAVTAP
jgi:hypothetical protein